ncbi:hypothetical protein H7X46_20785 [Pseudonocardia sp. C8]|uniref:Wzz/FepE/Etk N-terminal domain-containing protein n=1 Tax=Pseudonocardia sp. C8 TaxID=2762759 RepID=UPI001643408B|nr:Wzz/FepE/Etk N-terminal domain-containing protein [Pseudonocardia sp. C8]MBC3193501.1 hypothetical protein [Pseudonocardia sp. C8]
MADVQADEAEFGFWRRVVRRRWALILTIVLVGTAVAALLAALMLPAYSASAQVTVRNGDPVTETQFLGSSAVQDEVADRLGFRPDVVVTGAEGTILTVTANAGSAEQAVLAANTYVDTAVAMRARSAGSERAQVAEAFARQIAEVQAEREEPRTPPDRVRQLDQERAAYEQAAAAAQATPPAAIPTVLARATASDVTRPDPVLYTAGAAVVALLAGLAIAGAAEHADRRVRGAESAAAALAGTPLGTTPGAGDASGATRWWRRLTGTSRRGGIAEPGSADADAFTLVRRRLQGRGDLEPHGALLVCAADARDSANAVVVGVNLCQSFARAGLKAVLVSADFRGGDTVPAVLHLFAEGDGLGGVLAGGDPGAALQSTVTPGMQVLPAGRVPGGPYDALTGDRFAHALDELRLLADVLVVVAPPLTSHPDAFAVAEIVDLRLVVAGPDARVPELERAARELARTGTSVDGVIYTAGRART